MQRKRLQSCDSDKSDVIHAGRMSWCEAFYPRRCSVSGPVSRIDLLRANDWSLSETLLFFHLSSSWSRSFAARVSTGLMGILLQPSPSHRSALPLAKWSLCTRFSLVLRALINNRSVTQGWKGRPPLIPKRKKRETIEKNRLRPLKSGNKQLPSPDRCNTSTKRGQRLPGDQFYSS